MHHPPRGVPHIRHLLRHPALLLGGLLLLGLALRLAYLAANQLEPGYSPTDDGDYYRRALRFATTGEYLDDHWFIRSPLHVLLFGGLLRLSILLGSIDGVLLIRAVQIAMSLLAIVLLYDLTRRLFTPRAGLVAAGIMAVWFPFIELPIHLFSEPLFLSLLIAHLWLLLCWRDQRRWWLLAAAGAVLGLAALARSTALYSLPLVLLWLLLELRPAHTPLIAWATLRGAFTRPFLHAAALLLLCCGLAILPWTIRNYLTYGTFILIDTIGPVNLWLITGDHNRQGSAILLAMPQAERHTFASSEVRRLFAEDPQRVLGLLFNGWERNLHEVLKLQYVVDFFGQDYFYMRPLREMALLGLAGELLWIAFVVGGVVALVAPPQPREVAFRVLALGWIGSTCLSIMVLHPEPRYSYPIWLMLTIYGAAVLAHPHGTWAHFRGQRWHRRAALLLAGAVLLLIATSRDYPRLISVGIQREQHIAAARHATAQGDDTTAIRALQAALAVQPGFVEARARLALLLIEQGELAAAAALLREGDEQELDLARGRLAAAQGDTAQAANLLRRAEVRRSADMQQFGRAVLPLAPTHTLMIGDGLDLGYVQGFSPAETLPDGTPYRWLEAGNGTLTLPLPAPLDAGSVVALRLHAGRPEGAHLRVAFGAGTPAALVVQGTGWRIYRLRVPPELAGQQHLTLHLRGDSFMPAHRHPTSRDLRRLSVMISGVQVVSGAP